MQTGLFVGIGKYNYTNDKEWAVRLNYPKTGLLLGYTDFGNRDKVGQALSLLSFMEFSVLKKYVKNLSLHVGIGTSYTNTQFDVETNPFNRAITTDLNWTFRSFLYLDLFGSHNNPWRLGLGYAHHSNGHTRLPNQGLNSLLVSANTTFDFRKNLSHSIDKPNLPSTSQTYISARFGIGQNVLSEKFNTKKEVYSVAFSVGKIINKTFKLGGGFYYRYYEHYYDYIKNNEALVEEQFPIFRDNPFGYATNFGLFGSAELLVGHFGIEFDLGLNIYKPFYKIDWQLNEGYSFVNSNGDTVEVLGELDWYYEIKRTVSSRLGLKYYFITNNKSPKHNYYIAAHINGNLGQADFTELSFGYVYRFKLKQKG